MISITDILHSIYAVTKLIYDQVQQVKANQAQCQRLYERVTIVTQAIKQLETVKDAEHYRSGLFALQKCLQNCLALVQTFVQKEGWFKHVLKAGMDKERFESVNAELQTAIAQLDLGLNAQQIINREHDKVDQAKDNAAIQAQQDTIIKLNQEELKKIQELHLHQDELHMILMQQLTSMREQIKVLNVAQPLAKPPIDPKLVVPYFDIVFEQKIAQGFLGKIYRGRWCEQTVAIKTLEGELSSADAQQFIREVNIMGRLHNPNIVQLYGASLEASRACLVMEYMEQGSLWQLLRQTALNPEQQRQIALDIAKGLYYLHSKQILHRGLKSANVLISQYGQAKLSDFGLAKTQYSSIQTIKTQSQAVAWLAPETLDCGDYTEASDIYSFGMVVWEVVTGKPPYAGKKEADIISHVVDKGQREHLPAEVPDIYKKLIQQCWQAEPCQRPILTDILRQLEAYQPRPGSPSGEACYQQGLANEQKKAYVAAYQDYRHSACKGYIKAYANLGFFYLKGLGGAPLDKSEAFRNFMKGAESGHARAMANVATMLEHGDGVAKDLNQALYWYEQAAAQGDAKANVKAQSLRTLLQGSDYEFNTYSLAANKPY
jgi:serine/threonine protein kinase